jgi:hypothetical protein
MAGTSPAMTAEGNRMDGRDKPGHDGRGEPRWMAGTSPAMTPEEESERRP